MDALDDELGTGFRGGDPAARVRFLRLATTEVLGFLRRRNLARGADAEEVAADAIADVVRRMEHLDPGRPVRAYLLTAAAHHAYGRHRRRKRRRERPLGSDGSGEEADADAPVASTPDPSRRTELADLMEVLLRCARRFLTTGQFDTFAVLLRHDWDNRRAAHELVREPGTVAVEKNRIRNALQPCRRLVEGTDP